MERGRNRRPTRIGNAATETDAARHPSISGDKHIDPQRAQSLKQVHGQTSRKFRLHQALRPISSISGRLKAASAPITRVARCSRKCSIWCGESKVRAVRAAVCGPRYGVTSRYARAATRARGLRGSCSMEFAESVKSAPRCAKLRRFERQRRAAHHSEHDQAHNPHPVRYDVEHGRSPFNVGLIDVGAKRMHMRFASTRGSCRAKCGGNKKARVTMSITRAFLRGRARSAAFGVNATDQPSAT